MILRQSQLIVLVMPHLEAHFSFNSQGFNRIHLIEMS